MHLRERDELPVEPVFVEHADRGVRRPAEPRYTVGDRTQHERRDRARRREPAAAAAAAATVLPLLAPRAVLVRDDAREVAPAERHERRLDVGRARDHAHAARCKRLVDLSGGRGGRGESGVHVYGCGARVRARRRTDLHPERATWRRAERRDVARKRGVAGAVLAADVEDCVRLGGAPAEPHRAKAILPAMRERRRRGAGDDDRGPREPDPRLARVLHDKDDPREEAATSQRHDRRLDALEHGPALFARVRHQR